MALIDVVKYEQRPGIIAYKFPSDELRWGTQLVVYPGQEAIFVKGGAICDRFKSGTYTLKSNNLPILNKIVNLPFGGDSPFQADVWFISLVDRLNLRWGTETPLQLEDPKYRIIVPVRSYGQWGFRVNDPEIFLRKIFGNMPIFDETMLQTYFRGVLLSTLSRVISNTVIEKRISLFDINMYLKEIADNCLDEIRSSFGGYGIEIITLNIISVNMPENDLSVLELKKAKSFRAELDVVGVDNYKLKRTFDFLETSAANESQSGGTMNWGLGLGTGFGLSKDICGLAGSALSQVGKEQSGKSSSIEYFISSDGKTTGPYTQNDLSFFLSKCSDVSRILVWKTGMQEWKPIVAFPELYQK